MEAKLFLNLASRPRGFWIWCLPLASAEQRQHWQGAAVHETGEQADVLQMRNVVRDLMAQMMCVTWQVHLCLGQEPGLQSEAGQHAQD